ncbi:protelomerase family protein [Pseudoalteromonas luteoviolacea]|uniref:protelomerase family protein n=1 Tax=Pseudoalteromonas luteoviolacea TaxID=43657 RepID=UPI001B391366|nr:protelomerase family protein [Pseudoalteromonas luteoviolacea]MBQ4840109.1 hypothetical protein [Pseudoalteromonas luteoviolacea]
MTDRNKTDKTQYLVRRLESYLPIREDSRKVSNHNDKLMKVFVRDAFGMHSERVEGRQIWSFNQDSPVTRGDLSASRVSAVLIKYRNAIKAMGAINANFEASLKEARELLKEFGALEDEYKGLKPNIMLSTLEDRISIISKKYRSNGSHINAAKIRAAVNGIEIYHPLYYKIKAPLSFAKSIANEKNKLALKEKHDVKIRVNVESLYKKSIEVLEDSSNRDWVDMTIALCALTGRRPTEIMKTARFVKSENRDDYVVFNGILKARDRKLGDDFGNWEIPVFAKPELIVKSLRTMRMKLNKHEKVQHESGAKGGYWGGGYVKFISRTGKEVEASIFDKRYKDSTEHNEAINQQYNGTLNERIRKWLETGDFDVHSLRAIYTKAVYEREKDTSPESYESMTTRVLCYSTDTISGAVKHYAALEIDNTVKGVEVFKGEQKQDLMKPDSESLKQKLTSFDAVIAQKGVKAKKLPDIHEWAKARCENGMIADDLTASFIRKNCKVKGKAVNADTAGLYLVLVDMVDELETQTMKYFKDPNGVWLVESKKTGQQKQLIEHS